MQQRLARWKVSGKIIPLNVFAATLDNVSFRSESSVQNWKYVFQRRISYKRELSKKSFDCNDIIELIKVVGPFYEKFVKEFIVNISAECNDEGYKKYRKAYDRGKSMKPSHPIIDDYLGRINVTSIDQIMTKEEEETASEDEEEHYGELLKYNDIMELLSDSQLFKTLLIAKACYHRLMKEIVVYLVGLFL